MKKLISVFLALLMICGIFAGCSDFEKEYGSRIYYINNGDETSSSTVLSWENHEISQVGKEERIRMMIERMKLPKNPDNIAAIPRNVMASRVSVTGGTVTVDFSESFNGMTQLDRALLVSALCMTLFEEQYIEFIRITCVGNDIGWPETKYISRSTILLFDSPGESQTVEVTLLYMPAQHGRPVEVTVPFRTVSAEVSPATVFALLVSPIDDPELLPPFREGAFLDSLVIEEGSCKINIIPNDLDQVNGNDVKCVVVTLCMLPEIENVTVLIDGQPPSYYGIIGMDGVLTYNPPE